VARIGSATLPGVAGDDGAGRGRFVTIEGPEGAGKTSQAERLRRRVVAAGLDVVVTREPGGTAVGERVRAILLDPAATHVARTDALLFNAARAQLVADVIRPALERGAVVISTRFADSTLAYQGFGGRLPLDDLRRLEAFATNGLRPDLTILLDLPAEVGLARKGTETTRFESRFGLDFHRRVRDGFRTLADGEPDRFVVVDAAAPEEQVGRAVLAALTRLPGLAVVSAAPGDR